MRAFLATLSWSLLFVARGEIVCEGDVGEGVCRSSLECEESYSLSPACSHHTVCCPLQTFPQIDRKITIVKTQRLKIRRPVMKRITPSRSVVRRRKRIPIPQSGLNKRPGLRKPTSHNLETMGMPAYHQHYTKSTNDKYIGDKYTDGKPLSFYYSKRGSFSDSIMENLMKNQVRKGHGAGEVADTMDLQDDMTIELGDRMPSMLDMAMYPDQEELVKNPQFFRDPDLFINPIKNEESNIFGIQNPYDPYREPSTLTKQLAGMPSKSSQGKNSINNFKDEPLLHDYTKVPGVTKIHDNLKNPLTKVEMSHQYEKFEDQKPYLINQGIQYNPDHKINKQSHNIHIQEHNMHNQDGQLINVPNQVGQREEVNFYQDHPKKPMQFVIPHDTRKNEDVSLFHQDHFREFGEPLYNKQKGKDNEYSQGHVTNFKLSYQQDNSRQMEHGSTSNQDKSVIINQYHDHNIKENEGPFYEELKKHKLVEATNFPQPNKQYNQYGEDHTTNFKNDEPYHSKQNDDISLYQHSTNIMHYDKPDHSIQKEDSSSFYQDNLKKLNQFDAPNYTEQNKQPNQFQKDHSTNFKHHDEPYSKQQDDGLLYQHHATNIRQYDEPDHSIQQEHSSYFYQDNLKKLNQFDAPNYTEQNKQPNQFQKDHSTNFKHHDESYHSKKQDDGLLYQHHTTNRQSDEPVHSKEKDDSSFYQDHLKTLKQFGTPNLTKQNKQHNQFEEEHLKNVKQYDEPNHSRQKEDDSSLHQGHPTDIRLAEGPEYNAQNDFSSVYQEHKKKHKQFERPSYSQEKESQLNQDHVTREQVDDPNHARQQISFKLNYFDKQDEVIKPEPTTHKPTPIKEKIEQARHRDNYLAMFRQNKQKKASKRISQLKCEEYKAQLTETVTELSKNGAIKKKEEKCKAAELKNSASPGLAKHAEFPHIVGLGYEEDGDIIWGCNGVIISEYYILTAAHCVNTPLGRPVKAEVGKIRLEVGKRQSWRISQAKVHPLYNATGRYNDIALLKMAKRLRLSDSVRPACLYSRNTHPTNAVATFWEPSETLPLDVRLSGNLSSHRLSSEDTSVSLKKAPYTILEGRDCGIPSDTEESLLCTRTQYPGTICMSEGGGEGLQTRLGGSKCVYSLIGIASMKSCEEPTTSIYTRVSHFLPWIESIVWA